MLLTPEKFRLILTLLDTSAAFDTINHTILLTRLEYTFGVHSTALAWFKSYLYDRFHKVSVNNMQSDPVKLSCRVPQSSVLGPVLFTLYTTPLASIINLRPDITVPVDWA